MSTVNSFGTRTPLVVGGRSYLIHSLPALQDAGFSGIARLPYSMKILLETIFADGGRRALNYVVKVPE